MSEEGERRANQNPRDVTGTVAILYTIGFLFLATLLYFVDIPDGNKDALLYLFGILSGIELSIIAFYFGSSKNAEAIQRSTEQRSARTESNLQKVIEAVPAVAAAAAGAALAPDATVTPAPKNPATGNVPAAETAEKPKE